MDYKEVGKIVEKAGVLVIADVDGMQWVGIHGAMYSMCGLPRITSCSQALQILCIDQSKWGRIRCIEPPESASESSLIHVAVLQSDHGVWVHPWTLNGCTVGTLDGDGATIIQQDLLKPIRKCYDGILTQGSDAPGWRLGIPILFTQGYIPQAVIWPSKDSILQPILSDIAGIIDMLRKYYAIEDDSKSDSTNDRMIGGIKT